MNIRLIIFSVIILSIVISFSNCRKDNFTTNPNDRLIFSIDTVSFDTIFTNIGSTTRHFTVKNPNKTQSIKIDKIFLAKGENSKYRLNIDGLPVNSYSDYILAPGDSLYIFVEVTIDPNRDEMIEHDSIIFIYNNNLNDVDLVAFGQDVHLINGRIFNNDTIWTADKPFLIYNSALVDTFATLTINAGTRVHFHRGSSLFVKGSLKVNGELGNPVLFAGDRLEEYYQDIPGQWGAFIKDELGNTRGVFGGIHLLAGSRYNEINYANIRNPMIGLQVDSVVTPGIPTLILKNSNIENASITGLYALGSHIVAENCVFANCGRHTVACIIGGEYYFTHCTMANYYRSVRQTPQIVLNNYYHYSLGGQTYVSNRDLINAHFTNCIIYGSRENEIGIDLTPDAMANFRFDNCLIRYADYSELIDSDFFIDNIFNESPNFVSTSSPYDYRLDTLSAAKDAAKMEFSVNVPYDQDGNNRISDGKPDIGAFERIE